MKPDWKNKKKESKVNLNAIVSDSNSCRSIEWLNRDIKEQTKKQDSGMDKIQLLNEKLR